MKTANEVFTSPDNPNHPGSLGNSKSFSHTHSNENFQVGGNRLTGAWHPQDTHSQDFTKHSVHAARPSQHKIGATGVTGRVGQKVPFNNTNVRHLAGSPHAGVEIKAFRGANSLDNQHSLRATARGLSGLDTTSRRGGSSALHFVKSVAGTKDTYALPGTGGRGNAQLIKVQSVHNIGLHKIVVTKHIKATASRKGGTV
jgi:hypothetical protein